MTPKARRRMLNEVQTEEEEVMAECLKESLELVTISVHESTIRKTLNRHGVHGRTPQRKPLLTKKNIAPLLKLAKGAPRHSTTLRGKYFVNWWNEVELFRKNTQHYIWCKKGTATWKHRPDGDAWWRDLGRLCCPGGLDSLPSLGENKQVYPGVLHYDVRVAVCQPKLRSSWVMQQDSDLLHLSHDRAFTIAAPRLWNSLPFPARSPPLSYFLISPKHSLNTQSEVILLFAHIGVALFGGYCCQRRFDQLLNSRVHLLFQPAMTPPIPQYRLGK